MPGKDDRSPFALDRMLTVLMVVLIAFSVFTSRNWFRELGVLGICAVLAYAWTHVSDTLYQILATLNNIEAKLDSLNSK